MDNWWEPDGILKGQDLVDMPLLILSYLCYNLSVACFAQAFFHSSVSHGTSDYFNPFFFPNRFKIQSLDLLIPPESWFGEFFGKFLWYLSHTTLHQCDMFPLFFFE